MTRFVFGLTGGIASGKSTFATELKKLGARTLDADQVAREVRKRDPKVRSTLQALFGSPKRAVIRKKVFRDPAALRKLETVMIPRIVAESERRFRKWFLANPKRPIVYEASLLIETGRAKDFRNLLVVSSPMALRMKRLTENRGMTQDEARRRIRAQTSDAKRRMHADFWISNLGSKKHLRKQARQIFDSLKAVSASNRATDL